MVNEVNSLTQNLRALIIRLSAAKDRFRNWQPALILARGNGSSCPTPAVRDTGWDRLNWHPGVSTVRYAIPDRIFDYVSTVRSAPPATCQLLTSGEPP